MSFLGGDPFTAHLLGLPCKKGAFECPQTKEETAFGSLFALFSIAIISRLWLKNSAFFPPS